MSQAFPLRRRWHGTAVTDEVLGVNLLNLHGIGHNDSLGFFTLHFSLFIWIDWKEGHVWACTTDTENG